jgi:hypothetical protein
MIESQLRIDAQTIGICCFTENGSSSYMSHFYAGEHSGICLEFSTTDAPFSRAMPVSYQRQPPELRVIGDAGAAHEARMFVKAIDWTQEREWRIVNHREHDGAVHKFSPDSLVSISLCPNFGRESLLTLKSWLAERSMLGHKLPACFRFVRVQESYELQKEPIDLRAVS